MSNKGLILRRSETGTYLLATPATIVDGPRGTWVDIEYRPGTEPELAGVYDVSAEILRLALEQLSEFDTPAQQGDAEGRLSDVWQIREHLEQSVNVGPKDVVNPEPHFLREYQRYYWANELGETATERLRHFSGNQSLSARNAQRVNLHAVRIVQRDDGYFAETPLGPTGELVEIDVTDSVDALVQTLIESAMVDDTMFEPPALTGIPIQRGRHLVSVAPSISMADFTIAGGRTPLDVHPFSGWGDHGVRELLPDYPRTATPVSDAEREEHSAKVYTRRRRPEGLAQLEQMGESRVYISGDGITLEEQHRASRGEWRNDTPAEMLATVLSISGADARITGRLAEKLARGDAIDAQDFAGLELIVEASRVGDSRDDVGGDVRRNESKAGEPRYELVYALRALGGRDAGEPGDPSLARPGARLVEGEFEFILPEPFNVVTVRCVSLQGWRDVLDRSQFRETTGVDTLFVDSLYVQRQPIEALQAARDAATASRSTDYIDSVRAVFDGPPLLIDGPTPQPDGSLAIAMPVRAINRHDPHTPERASDVVFDIRHELPIRLLELAQDPLHEQDHGWRTALLPPGWGVRPAQPGENADAEIFDTSGEAVAYIAHEPMDGIYVPSIRLAAQPPHRIVSDDPLLGLDTPWESFADLWAAFERATAAYEEAHTRLDEYDDSVADDEIDVSTDPDFDFLITQETVAQDGIRDIGRAIIAQRDARGNTALMDPNPDLLRVLGPPPVQDDAQTSGWVQGAGRIEETFERSGIDAETGWRVLAGGQGNVEPRVLEEAKLIACSVRWIGDQLPLASLQPDESVAARMTAPDDTSPDAVVHIRGAEGLRVVMVPPPRPGDPNVLERPELSGHWTTLREYQMTRVDDEQGSVLRIEPRPAANTSGILHPPPFDEMPVLRIPANQPAVIDGGDDIDLVSAPGARVQFVNPSGDMRAQLAGGDTVTVGPPEKPGEHTGMFDIGFSGELDTADLRVAETGMRQFERPIAEARVGDGAVAFTTRESPSSYELPVLHQPDEKGSRILVRDDAPEPERPAHDFAAAREVIRRGDEGQAPQIEPASPAPTQPGPASAAKRAPGRDLSAMTRTGTGTPRPGPIAKDGPGTGTATLQQNASGTEEPTTPARLTEELAPRAVVQPPQPPGSPSRPSPEPPGHQRGNPGLQPPADGPGRVLPPPTPGPGG